MLQFPGFPYSRIAPIVTHITTSKHPNGTNEHETNNDDDDDENLYDLTELFGTGGDEPHDATDNDDDTRQAHAQP